MFVRAAQWPAEEQTRGLSENQKHTFVHNFGGPKMTENRDALLTGFLNPK